MINFTSVVAAGLGLLTGALGLYSLQSTTYTKNIINLRDDMEKLKYKHDKIECIKMEKDNKQTIQDKIQLLQDYNRLR